LRRLRGRLLRRGAELLELECGRGLWNLSAARPVPVRRYRELPQVAQPGDRDPREEPLQEMRCGNAHLVAHPAARIHPSSWESMQMSCRTSWL
jgi:hypothetical protein